MYPEKQIALFPDRGEQGKQLWERSDHTSHHHMDSELADGCPSPVFFGAGACMVTAKKLLGFLNQHHCASSSSKPGSSPGRSRFLSPAHPCVQALETPLPTTSGSQKPSCTAGQERCPASTTLLCIPCVLCTAVNDFPPGQRDGEKRALKFSREPPLVLKNASGGGGGGKVGREMGVIVRLHKASGTVNALTLRIIYTINKVTCFSNNLDVSKC